MMPRLFQVASGGVALLLAGCTQYLQVRDDLVRQSRRGLALVSESIEGRNALLRQFFESKRARLDQAFDADARARLGRDADWVIAARKAYAAGIDAIHTQQAASNDAHRMTRENLSAIEQALAQLQWLHELERRLNPLENGR